MADAIRDLLAKWERGIQSLYAANEEEAVPVTRMIRAARAAQIECCVYELREALSAPTVLTALRRRTAGLERHRRPESERLEVFPTPGRPE